MNLKRNILLWLAFAFGTATFIYFNSSTELVSAERSTPVSRGGRSQPPVTKSAPPTSAAANNDAKPLDYSGLRKILSEEPKRVTALTFLSGSFDVKVSHDGKESLVKAPTAVALDELRQTAQSKNIPVEGADQPKVAESKLWTLILTFGPTILIVVLILYFLRGASKSLTKKKTAGPRGRVVEKKTFNDIAGQDGAVRLLRRLLHFQRNGGLFAAFRAKRPKGVLLVGPPGTGKTLLVQALAGEGDCDVHAVAASDFVEMFVGVGASRIREMFDARKLVFKQTGRLQIIFIDELDAIGGERSSKSAAGGHNEREQTLNALLVELDGAEKESGIIPIAATNRVELLDPALTRPGRFDYQVRLDLPDLAGREAILKIHTRGMPLSEDVDFRSIARRFTGSSGAYLQAIANEAALLAAEEAAERQGLMSDDKPAAPTKPYTRGLREPIQAPTVTPFKRGPKDVITASHFDRARAVVEFGDPRLSLQRGMTESQKRNIAVHEVGHAWMAEFFPWGHEVAAVDIIPRAGYLGVTVFQPEGEEFLSDSAKMRNRIKTLMGGRVAQEVLLGVADSGAQNDFQKATVIARQMVAEYGMSELGVICIPEHASVIGRERGHAVSQIGPDLMNEIDRLTCALVNECHAETKIAIEANKVGIAAISEVMLRQETILGPEWKELAKTFPMVAPAPTKVEPATV